MRLTRTAQVEAGVSEVGLLGRSGQSLRLGLPGFHVVPLASRGPEPPGGWLDGIRDEMKGL